MSTNINTTDTITSVSTPVPASSPASDSTSKDLEFLNLQTPEFRDAYQLYLSMSSSGSTPALIQSAIASDIAASYNISETAASKMASIAMAAFSSPSFYTQFIDYAAITKATATATSDHAFILQSDATSFHTFTAVDPHSSFELRCLLMSLLVNYRRNYHPKGWVRYDRRAIMYMAGLSAASAKVKEELTSYLHREYGMEMQVVGSNSPMPCYMFPWAKDSLESPVNPRIDLGAYAPSSIFSAVSRFGGSLQVDLTPSPIQS